MATAKWYTIRPVQVEEECGHDGISKGPPREAAWLCDTSPASRRVLTADKATNSLTMSSVSEDRSWQQKVVVEATLDFRAAQSDAPSLGTETFSSGFSGYKVSPLAEASSSDLRHILCRFTSEDGAQFLHIRDDGFSLIRRADYEGWDALAQEASKVWDAYVEALPGAVLKRVGVRYLNELMIPIEVPLHRFFRIYPAMPDPGTLFNFFSLMVETSIETPRGRLQTFIGPRRISEDRRSVGIQLENEFTFRYDRSVEMRRYLEQIQEVMSETFQSQITDELRETLK